MAHWVFVKADRFLQNKEWTVMYANFFKKIGEIGIYHTKNADSSAESRDPDCIPNMWNNLVEGIGAGGVCWLNFWREEAVRWRAKETACGSILCWQNGFLRKNGNRDAALRGGLVAQSSPTFVAPWTIGCQAPLCKGFPRQEYWGGLPFPPPGNLPNPGIEPRSPALQVDCLPTALPGKIYSTYTEDLNSLMNWWQCGSQVSLRGSGNLQISKGRRREWPM